MCGLYSCCNKDTREFHICYLILLEDLENLMVFTWIIKHLTLFFNFLIFYNIFMVSLDKIMLEIKTKISNKKDIVPKSKKKMKLHG